MSDLQSWAQLVTPTDSVLALEKQILTLPQVDLNTQHSLAGGVYARTVYIPAGTVVTGATHKKDHISVVIGDITITTDEGPVRITGHHVLPTKAGSKRAVVAHADTVWTTLVRTDLSDIEAIEDELVVESSRLQTRQTALPPAAASKVLEE